MTFVVYNGPHDAMELGSADLKKAGVEGFSKSTFEQGSPYEVDEEVAQALTEHSIFADHGFSVVDDPRKVEQPKPPMTAHEGGKTNK